MARNTSGLKHGGSSGRPKGVPNKATREFKAWAEKFFRSAAYRQSAERRILKGRALPLETYLAQLLHGKPKDQVEHSGEVGGVPAILNVFTDGRSSDGA